MEKMQADEKILQKVNEWLSPAFDEATKEKIKDLIENAPKELTESFYKDLEFGTGGMRGVMGVGSNRINKYTLGKNTQGLSNYLKKTYPDEELKVAIAYDCRHNSDTLAKVVAEVFSANGIKVYLFSALRPTPELSFSVKHLGCHCGIVLTASHNPPEYQGIKFSTADGAPALPEVTSEIERRIANGVRAEDGSGGSVEEFDARDGYLKDLSEKVRMDVIKSGGGKYAFDPLWGTGRGYLDKILSDNGLAVRTLHDWRDVTFGGRSPEPGEDHLNELCETVRNEGLTLGLATDGDADRFGIIDSNGTFITPNRLIALLTDYLAESREGPRAIARSVATSHLVDRVAKERGLKVFETPVGFKFIGELINKDEIILGGEESAGMSIRGHFPEKDGILACLLAAESVAARGKSLSEQLEELLERVGNVESGRIGVRLTDDVAASLADVLNREPKDIGGREIESLNRMDGVKFIFSEESWMLLRPSGTEPLVRIYAESETKEDLEVLLEQGRNYLLG